MEKKGIAATMVALIVIIAATAILAFVVNADKPMEKVNRDRSVVLLCDFASADSILERIRDVTYNLSVSDNTSILSNIRYGQFMLLIDGDWLKTHQSDEFVGAVRTLILNGTPVVVINGTFELIVKATTGGDASFMSATASPDPIFPCYGLYYDPKENVTHSFNMLTGDNDLGLVAFKDYEWCSQFIA